MNTPKRPRVEGFVRAIETTPPLEVAPEQEEPLEQEGHSGMETTPKRPRVEGFVRAIETTPPLARTRRTIRARGTQWNGNYTETTKRTKLAYPPLCRERKR